MLGHLKKTIRYRRNGNIKGGSPPSINCGGECVHQGLQENVRYYTIIRSNKYANGLLI